MITDSSEWIVNNDEWEKYRNTNSYRGNTTTNVSLSKYLLDLTVTVTTVNHEPLEWMSWLVYVVSYAWMTATRVRLWERHITGTVHLPTVCVCVCFVLSLLFRSPTKAAILYAIMPFSYVEPSDHVSPIVCVSAILLRLFPECTVPGKGNRYTIRLSRG